MSEELYNLYHHLSFVIFLLVCYLARMLGLLNSRKEKGLLKDMVA